MKKIIVIASAALAIVGCNQEDKSIKESAGAQKDRVEQSEKAQKEALNQQKKQIESRKDAAEDQAKAQKEAAQAEAKAEKAQIDAQKEKVEADAKAQKAQIESKEKIQEAAGAATDAEIEMRVRTALGITETTPTGTAIAFKDIKISVKDGVVTLKGTVKTEAEKADAETKAKTVSGVKSVDNQIDVQA